MTTLQFNFRIDDSDSDNDIEVKHFDDDWQITVAGEPVAVTAHHAGEGEWILRQGARCLRAFVAGRGDERFVFIDGTVYTLVLPDPEGDADAGAAAGGPHVVAEMPGKVVKVTVQPEQEVAAGDTVVIMESMKMETEVRAPVTGKVAAVYAEVGQTVAQGDPLVDIDPVDSDSPDSDSPDSDSADSDSTESDSTDIDP
jgi:biotin carboxyl carrier protein